MVNKIVTLFLVLSAATASAQEINIWTEEFDTAESLDKFTVVNVNQDDFFWKYSASRELAFYNGKESPNPGNDWLISPALELKKNEIYRLNWTAKSLTAQYLETMGIYLGTSTDPSSMTQTLAENYTLQPNTKRGVKETIFRVQADGTYYLGFHATSEAMQMGVMLDDLYLSRICTDNCPEAPQLTVNAGALGEISCSGLVVVPKYDEAGNNLATVSKIEVLRQKQNGMELLVSDRKWESVYVNESVKPGDELQFTDENAAAGLYTYKAVATNENGSGMEARNVVVVGEDMPMPVTDIKVTRSGENVTLSWKAPEKGVNGGYINPEKLSYYLQFNLDQSYEVISEDYTGTEYTTELIPAEYKYPCSFTIRAKSQAAAGDAVNSTYLTNGEAYSLPFHDAFFLDKENLDKLPVWVNPTRDYRSWMIMSEMSQDGDGYCIVMYMGHSGLTLDMLSSEINLSNADSPILEFWYYYEPGYGSPLLQTVASVDYDEWEPIGEDIHPATANATNGGWTLVSVPLTDFAGRNNVRIGLRGTSFTPYDMLLVDNLSVVNGKAGIKHVANDNTIGISTTANTILISGNAEFATVSSADGMQIYNGNVNGSLSVIVPSGVYIVRAGTTVAKVLVK